VSRMKLSSVEADSMHAGTVIGKRVRRMRLVSGFGQVELAERIGVASGTISMLENDKVVPSGDLLRRIAHEVGCTVEYLARPEVAVVSSRPWLRAYADAPQKSLDMQTSDVTCAVEAILTLRLRRYPDLIPIHREDLEDYGTIESLAQDARSAAGIGEGQRVGNMIRAAERLGCLVLPMREELGRHLGLSTRVHDVPVICVSRPHDDPTRDVPGDRQRFTVAHELGHLALHTGLDAPLSAEEARRIERQAHRFAGAFLAPGDAMVNAVTERGGRVTLNVLAGIKSEWGVSIKALVTRMRDIALIDEEQARSLFKQISSRGWNRQEPVGVGNESAQWLAKAFRNIDENWLEVTGLKASHQDRWTRWNRVEAHSLAPLLKIQQSRFPGEEGGQARRGTRSMQRETPSYLIPASKPQPPSTKKTPK